MAGVITRRLALSRALAADNWLTHHAGVTLLKADAKGIAAYLTSLPSDQRKAAWEALVEHEDHLVRQGVIVRNAARGIQLGAPKVEDAPVGPDASVPASAAAAAPAPAVPKRTRKA